MKSTFLLGWSVPALLLCGVIVTGCSSTATPAASRITETDERGVEQCTFVALVNGSSMLGGAMQGRARENAKTDALNDAAEKGATHIVWVDVTSTVSNGASAQGRAYRCGT
jgi:hypothetical protein